MCSDDFVFLRATYWRWCEIIFDICPELATAPEVLAIGDTHLENFGTWRDAEGRLVWGVKISTMRLLCPMRWISFVLRQVPSWRGAATGPRFG